MIQEYRVYNWKKKQRGEKKKIIEASGEPALPLGIYSFRDRERSFLILTESISRRMKLWSIQQPDFKRTRSFVQVCQSCLGIVFRAFSTKYNYSRYFFFQNKTNAVLSDLSVKFYCVSHSNVTFIDTHYYAISLNNRNVKYYHYIRLYSGNRYLCTK